MAQKFITKKNRHLFRKPIKTKIEERVIIEIPPIKKEVVETIIEPEIVIPEIIEPAIIVSEMDESEEVKIKEEIDETKKRKSSKKSKDVTKNTE